MNEIPPFLGPIKFIGAKFLDWLVQKGFEKSAEILEKDIFNPFQSHTISNIQIIGLRIAGKTTYLSGLVLLKELVKEDKFLEKVNPIGSNAELLCSNARSVFKEKKSIESTDADDIKDYCFRIKLNNKCLKRWYQGRIELNMTDTPGDIVNKQQNIDTHRQLCHKITQAKGLILMIDPLSHEEDDVLATWISELCKQIRNKNIIKDEDKSKYRIACVFSKCEIDAVFTELHQGNINNIMAYMTNNFPKTKKALAVWKDNWNCSIEYFSCSVFGWLNHQDKDNRQPNYKIVDRSPSGITATIKDDGNWRPLNLLQPIYWLHTGTRSQELMRDEL